MKTRKRAFDSVNHAMTRFPMILEVLGKIREAEIPFPGDSDIEHGCERALTAILSELAKIKPTSPGESDERIETTLGWIHGDAAERLIQPDLLERFEQFIRRILSGEPDHSR